MADINLGVGAANSASGGYEIANSLKFEADNTEYLSHSSSSGSGTKVTYSFWCKRTELDSSSYMQVSGISTNSETVRFMFYQDSVRLDAGNGGTGKLLVTNRKFRDTSAWYHFFVVIDTTLSTEGDRHQLWVNGVRETSFSTEQYPTQNFSVATDQNNATWRYGAYDSTYYKFSGYLADCYRLDGIAATYTDFGEFDTNGIWIPKEYTGSFGSNGHYLDFEDSSSLGADDSGNSNNFTLNNIAAADQATDTPTNNFCTMNVILNGAATKCSFTEGATFVTGAASSTNWESRFGSFAVEAGKWYMELKADGSKSTNNIFVGFCGAEWHGYHSGNHLVFGGQEGALGLYGYNGDFYGGTGVHGFRIYDEDIVAMMLDADNGAMYFKRLAGANNAQVSEGTVTWSTDGTNTANPTSGASKTGAQLVDWEGATIPAFSLSKNVGGIETNFGGYNIISNTQSYSDANGYGSFVMEPPSGYYALCTKNLAEYG